MLKVSTDDAQGQTPETTQSLDELVREEACRMIAAAQEVEVEQCIHSLHGLRGERGHALVVRNGRSHHERTVQSAAGGIKIELLE